MADRGMQPAVPPTRFEPGSAVSARQLNALVDAINLERGVRVPGPVYPSKKNSVSKIIAATEWIWCDAANPTTVQTKNSTLKVRSDTLDTYEDATIGRIAIVNFGKNIISSGSEKCQLIFGELSGLLIESGTAGISGTVGGSGVYWEYDGLLKIIPIIASFAVSALDWHNVITVPTLTYGAALITGVEIVHGQIGGTIGDKPLEAFGESKGVAIFEFPSGTAFYGLQIEIAPHKITLNAGLTSTISAQMTTLTYASGLKHPTLILPAS